MLCYRCGSFTQDGSRKCTVCGQALVGRQRSKAAKRPATQNEPPYQAGEVVAERYRIVAASGHGCAGWVMRARDQEVDIDVALKLVSPNLVQTEDERAAFLKTVGRVRKIRHPNIVRIYEEGVDGHQAFYAMPHLEGLTLRKIIDLRLEKGQLFTLAEVLPLCGQMALAIDALDKSRPHGALRPTTVTVLPDVLKVTGTPHFGGLPRKPFVGAQHFAKSIHYLSPEARVEDTKLDRRADVYSLGAIAAEMLCGKVPNKDPNAWEEALSACPVEVRTVLEQALSTDPTKRFLSGSELFEALAHQSMDRTLADDGPAPEELTPEMTPAEAEAETSDVYDIAGPDLELDRTLAEAESEEEIDYGAHRESLKNLAQNGHGATRRTSAAMRWFVAVLLVSGAAFSWWRFVELPAQARSKKIASLEPVGEAPVVTTRSESLGPKELEGAPKKPDLAVVKPSLDAGDPETDAVTTVLANPPQVEDADPRPDETGADSPPSIVRRGVCPRGMRKIPAGTFEAGSRQNDPMRGFGEISATKIKNRGYCIDVHEYPNNRGRLPRVKVAWSEAKRVCAKGGKRLCSEHEWEMACKGPSNFRFPFGNRFVADLCNIADDEGGKLEASGVFAECRSGYGVADMAGNAAEWTRSSWSAEIPDKVVKGGTADQSAFAGRCAARSNQDASVRDGMLGFRCCTELGRSDD